MGNRCKYIKTGIDCELLQGFAIASKGGDALVPGGRRWRRRRLRPVFFRLRLLVIGVATEIQNVALAKPHMLQNLPRRIGKTGWLNATQPGGKPGYSPIEC